MRTRSSRRRGRIATTASILAITAAITFIATPTVAAAGEAVSVSAGSDPTTPPEVPATPGALIHGVGHFTYDEPGLHGHRIRFSVHARVAADGTTRGILGYRHLLPDGQVLGAGYAEVSCLSVHGNTALVAAVVPEGHGNVRNHGFYLKIIDGSRARPDQIETLQAQKRHRPPATVLHRHRGGPLDQALPDRPRRLPDPPLDPPRLAGCPRGHPPATSSLNLYPVCGGVQVYKQAKAKLHCIESDEVAVAFGPPA